MCRNVAEAWEASDVTCNVRVRLDRHLMSITCFCFLPMPLSVILREQVSYPKSFIVLFLIVVAPTLCLEVGFGHYYNQHGRIDAALSPRCTAFCTKLP
jgi:hypothetical protein